MPTRCWLTAVPGSTESTHRTDLWISFVGVVKDAVVEAVESRKL